MGLEIDLRELSPAELGTMKSWIGRYKQYRDLLHSGAIRRIETDDPAIYAHVVIDEDRGRFLLFAFFTETTLNSVQGPLRITGLDPSRLYELSLWEKPETPSPLMREFDSQLVSETPARVSGSFLEQVGIVLPVGFPDSAVVLKGKSPMF
jgi:alpha-galactosidase